MLKNRSLPSALNGEMQLIVGNVGSKPHIVCSRLLTHFFIPLLLVTGPPSIWSRISLTRSDVQLAALSQNTRTKCDPGL